MELLNNKQIKEDSAYAVNWLQLIGGKKVSHSFLIVKIEMIMGG